MRLLRNVVLHPSLFRVHRLSKNPVQKKTDDLVDQAKESAHVGKEQIKSVTQDIGDMIKEAGHTVKEQTKQAVQAAKEMIQGHCEHVATGKSDTTEPPTIGEAADKGAPDQGINRGILDDFCRSKQAAEQAADDTIGETIQQAKASASQNGKVQRGTEHHSQRRMSNSRGFGKRAKSYVGKRRKRIKCEPGV